MKHAIIQWILSSPGAVEISVEDYQEIKLAKENLENALFIEDKFDLVLENYFEFEMQLLSSATRWMIFREQDYSWLQVENALINRRLVNLLTTCRMYIDQIVHHLANIYGESSLQIADIRNEISNQYDNHFGYRVMEALRNFVQHRGLPVEGTKFDQTRLDGKDGSRLRFTVIPYINPQLLDEDKSFKRTVLKELMKCGNEIDIKPLVREYIESIASIHEKIRSILIRDESDWESRVQQAIDLFKTKFGTESSNMALSIVAIGDDKKISERIRMSNDLIARRRELESKNRFLGSLVSRYATNEVIDSDE